LVREFKLFFLLIDGVILFQFKPHIHQKKPM